MEGGSLIPFNAVITCMNSHPACQWERNSYRDPLLNIPVLVMTATGTGGGVDPHKAFVNKEMFTTSAVPDWYGLDFLSSPSITVKVLEFPDVNS